MSARSTTKSMEGKPIYQSPPPPYSPSPGPSIYQSTMPVYNSPGPPASLPPYSVMKRQNNYFPGQYGPWPYQPWGGYNMFSVSPTYQYAAYPYNLQCIPAMHPITNPPVPQYVPPTPYMIHPQAMPQTLPGCPPSYSVTHPQAMTQSQSFPDNMHRSQTKRKNTIYSTLKSSSTLTINNRKCQSEGEGKALRWIVEADESDSSGNENSEEENNKSQKVGAENGSENLSDQTSESDTSGSKYSERQINSMLQEINEEDEKKNISGSVTFTKEKIEGKNEDILQEMTVRKGPNKLDQENGSPKNHSPTSNISNLDHTKNNSKKKKKKRKHRGNVEEECSTVSSEDPPVFDLTQSLKNEKEYLKLKGKKSLQIIGHLKHS